LTFEDVTPKMVKRVTFGLLCLVFLLILICPLNTPAQAEHQTELAGKNILILHAFERTMPLNEATDRGLRASLDSGGIGTKNQFFEYLDLASMPGPEYRKRLAELMRLRYSQRKIDMVITFYAEALQFLLNEGRDVFPNVPILTLYMSPGIELPKTDRRIIDQQVSYDMVGTLEIALKLVPGTKRVYVVSGVANTDKRMENQAKRDFKKWEGRLEFQYLSNMSLEQILTTVSSAPPNSIILFVAFILDSAGKTYTSREVVQQISRISQAPIFGLYDTLLGHGIVGGFLASYERNGTEAGELVLKILGSNQGQEKVPAILKVPPKPMFDWRQLRRWKLSEAALPKGSVVINKELTLWDFRYYIFGVLAFVVVESVLIVILITERRRKIVVEKSLGQKTEEFDQFFNVSLDIMCIANTDGYFLRLNPAAEKILGYSSEELMAKRLFEFVHPDDLERTREAVSSLASQKRLFFFENRYRCKDGAYRWLEWSASPAEKLIYAAARDITERKQAEQESFETRRELMRMDRLSRMGELSASLSHELNQPLTAILSNAKAALRLLKANELSPGELEEILQDIAKDDKRAGDIIRSLRTLVKRDEGERETISINDVLHEAVSLFRSEAIIRNIRIEMDLADSLPLLYINRVQIQQVLINLMMNAAESMVRDESANKIIVLKTLVSHGGVVQVAVRDFGSGIEEQELTNIFEPFFTTKRSGLGMGLSISRSIIESLGGHIWAENNPDKGVTFYFDLPVIKNE
jgi:PAS domain S-box-containing protein